MKSAKLQTEAQHTPRMVVCGGCALCCDDISIAIRDTKVELSSNICQLGREWYDKQTRQASPCRVNGRVVDLAAAIAAAREILENARNPLVCGLKWLSISDLQSCVRLAAEFGASLNIGWANSDGRLSAEFQELGQVTATLGQIDRQCQTIVFWRTEPFQSLPRLVERFCGKAREIWFVNSRTSVEQTGRALPRNLRIVSLDDSPSVEIDFLRQVMVQLNMPSVGGVTNLAASTEIDWLPEFMQAMKTSTGVAWFIDGSTSAGNDEPNRLIHRIVRKLNDFTKCYLISHRGNGNLLGAENVLAWTFGFPGATNLNQGVPRWNRDEYSAATMLRRNPPDCVLTLTADGDGPNSEQMQLLAKTPTIVLHADSHPLIEQAAVSIPIARNGWDSEGDVCRLDDVVVSTEKLFSLGRMEARQIFAELIGHSLHRKVGSLK